MEFHNDLLMKFLSTSFTFSQWKYCENCFCDALVDWFSFFELTFLACEFAQLLRSWRLNEIT